MQKCLGVPSPELWQVLQICPISDNQKVQGRGCEPLAALASHVISQALVGLAPGREGAVAGGQRPVVEEGGQMQGCPPLSGNAVGCHGEEC